MKLVAQVLVVHAPADQLYELLVDPELFVQWMADDATLDPVPPPAAGEPVNENESPPTRGDPEA